MATQLQSENKKAPEKPSSEGFERIFEIIGGHGKFQWFLLGVVSLELVVMTWNHMGYIFTGAVPSHFCRVDQLEGMNWTSQQIKQLAIPKIRNGDNTKHDECSYFDLDYSELINRFNGEYESILNHVRRLENVSTTECSAWVYDTSIYTSTVASEFNLVCGRRYLAATIQSTYMVGGLAGTFIFGALNDRLWGRRNSVLIAVVITLVAGFLASMSNSYWMFVILRIFIAFGTAGTMQTSSILLLEHCDISSRARFYCISGTFFGVGYAILAIYAYFLRSWTSLQLAFSLTTLSLLSYYWIFPESPRWLASTGQDEKALEALRKIAKMNGKEQPKRSDVIPLLESCHKHHSSRQPENQSNRISSADSAKKKAGEILSSFKCLLNTREACRRTLTIWALFVIVAFVYYGFAFSTNLTSDPYLLVALGGLMEIPACIVPMPFLSFWGRRPTSVLCFFLTGISSIAIAATPAEYETLRIIFTMSGKFFVAAVFNVLYLVASELYPTIARTTGQAGATIMGRIGSIAAPYVADLLTTVYPDLPCVIFGVVSLVGAAISLLLPEMKDMEMMDQVSELEMEPI